MKEIKKIILVGFISLMWYSNLISQGTGKDFPQPSPGVISSPYEFAKFIRDTFDTDYEKTEFIYTWIINNIAYDVKAYLSNSPSSTTPENVIKNKKAVCDGYATLFDFLANQSGVVAFKVSGYVADNVFMPCKAPTRAKHVWNIFFADSEWHLVDVTWGSGYVKNSTSLNNLMLKLFKQPKISSKYQFIARPDYTYFDTDKRIFRETHIPVDPMWQLSDTLLAVEALSCDAAGRTQNINSSFKGMLANYSRQNPVDRQINSGRRAYNFNKENPRVMAKTYLNAGELKFDITQGLMNTKPEELVKQYTVCSNYFDSAMYFLMFDKSEIKSEMKNQLKEQKVWLKTLTKANKTYLKTNNKQIIKNQKSLSQSIKRKNNLEALIKDLKRQNYDLYYDDKIYEIERPLQELSGDLVTEKLNQINSNNNIFIETKKIVNDIFDAVDNTEDSLSINVEQVFAIIDSNIYLQNTVFELLSQLNPLHISKVDSLYAIISKNKDITQSIKVNNTYQEKTGFKENEKLLKNTYKTLQQITKENKKLYIEIKKVSNEESDEDYLYAIENENLIEENEHLMSLSQRSIESIEERKQYMKEENKVLKKEIKSLKQLDKIVIAYYEARVKQINTYYNGELQWITNSIARTKANISDCKKALKESAK